uniref:Uncharacterized protein n=1 Tax=Pseudomonas phage Cygsa01 TaxID=3138529 RepID=A0AAU6W3F2_9VIRU
MSTAPISGSNENSRIIALETAERLMRDGNNNGPVKNPVVTMLGMAAQIDAYLANGTVPVAATAEPAQK